MKLSRLLPLLPCALAASAHAQITVESVSGSNRTNLFAGETCLSPRSRPLPFIARVKNAGSDARSVPVKFVVSDDRGREVATQTRAIAVPAGVTSDVTFSLAAPGYGWYGIQVEAGGAKRRSGFSVLHPARPGTRPSSIFGISTGDTSDDREIAALIGVKWRRGVPGLHQSIVSPRKGEWWNDATRDRSRDVVREWRDSGVLCLGALHYLNDWNTIDGVWNGKPADVAAHAEVFHRAIADLYPDVPNWEIWNEPTVYGHFFQNGNAQDFRDMIGAIWKRVKPDYPDVNLIAGSYTHFQRDVLYAQGVKDAGLVDGTQTHPYGEPNLFTPVTFALEAEMNKRYGKTGGRAGVWATEFGTLKFANQDGSVPPKEEQRFLVARTIAPFYLLGQLGAGKTPTKLFYFQAAYGKRPEGDESYPGCLFAEKFPEPAIAAYSAMTHFCEDGVLRGDLWAGSKNGWALHYERPVATGNGTEQVVVLWSERGYDASRTRPATISLPSLDFVAYDYVGRPTGTVKNGSLILPTQTWEVRYLVSRRGARDVAKAVRAARIEGRDALFVNPCPLLDAPGGKQQSLRVKVENRLPHSTDVTLRLTPPVGWTLARASVTLKKVPSGAVRYAEFPVTASAILSGNRYPVSWDASTSEGDHMQGTREVQAAVVPYNTPKCR